MSNVTKIDPATDDRQRKQEFFLSLLKHPGESTDTDYKSSVAFDGKNDFSLKIIKHVLGMINGGGGYLVIGFPEDNTSKPQPDPNITDDIVASYEATKFPQMVAKKIRGTDKPDIRVHHISYQDKIYPIIEIGEFEKRPFFCNSDHVGGDGKQILRQGALYIRTASSNTEEVSSPEEWEKLMQIASRKRNEELLDRFSSLIEQVQQGTSEFKQPKKQSQPKPPAWYIDQRKVAEAAMGKAGFNKGYFEVMSYLPNGSDSWNQGDLLNAMTKAVLRNTGWPEGVVLHVDEKKPKPVRNGIQATIVSESFHRLFDHWGLSKSGAYYFCRTFHEDFLEDQEVPILGFDTRIWRIAEAIDHTFSLYSQLQIDPQQQVSLEITHKGLKGRHLVANDPRRLMFRDYISEENVATWKVTTTLDALKVNRKTYIHDAIRSLVVFFDFFDAELKDNIIDQIIDEYDNSRL